MAVANMGWHESRWWEFWRKRANVPTMLMPGRTNLQNELTNSRVSGLYRHGKELNCFPLIQAKLVLTCSNLLYAWTRRRIPFLEQQKIHFCVPDFAINKEREVTRVRATRSRRVWIRTLKRSSGSTPFDDLSAWGQRGQCLSLLH